MPTKTSYFCGRDSEVHSLVDLLTKKPTDVDSKLPRICILGLGGIGKTELVLAVATDPEVKQCYAVENLVWVSCIPASSPALLLDTLYEALDINQDTYNTLDGILTHLQSSPPVVLVLDDFETPWNSDNRSEVSRILEDIEKLPHVALLVTMRGSHGPCETISWTEKHIQPLTAEESRQLFTKIDTKAINDLNLSRLVGMLHHMPLAVTLMSQQGKLTGKTCRQLINSFKDAGSTLMGTRGSPDRQTSLSVSIGLSVQSGPIQQEPNAWILLVILSMLPSGATFETLGYTWAPQIGNLSQPLTALLEASLLEKRDTTFLVHPLIRSYVLDPSRFPRYLRLFMIQSACHFLITHHSKTPRDPSYKADFAARSFEEINLQAILLKTTNPETPIIRALLTLAKHHARRPRPRTEVIEHAVRLAKQGSDGKLLSNTLYYHGIILEQLRRYQEAIEQYILARHAYLKISDTIGAATTLIKMAYIYTFINPDINEIPLIAQALREFESIPDERGVLRTLVRLGEGLTRWRNYTEAIAQLIRAREMCSGLSINGAECAQKLCTAYHRLGQYDQAEIWATTACREFKELGNRSDIGHCLVSLGSICISKGNYDQAISSLMESLEVWKAQGKQLSVADTLLDLGRAWMKKGIRARAEFCFREAFIVYKSIQGQAAQDGTIICVFYLDKLTDPSRVPTSDEVRALGATNHTEDIPTWLLRYYS
ncbi:hypothetical protein C8J56DRAFT_7714 [Mycena floridula]|nr:hypothetical protein C8J56DRAFT_7714 [Mycena floridula]